MARKAQREWTQVSDLVGRIAFSVKSGKPGDANFVPATAGFIVEVTYESQSDKMYNALCNSAVAVQGTVRRYYAEHQRFPFAPGKLQKVNSKGGFDLPDTVYMDKVEAKAKAGEMTLEDKIRLAEAMGAIVPQEWRLAMESTSAGEQSVDFVDDGDNDGLKYDETVLEGLSLAKLRKLAQDEELEGYDELTKEELVSELAMLEKE